MAWEIVARHHEEQKLIARNAVAELHPLWGILDFHDLPGTTSAWLKAVRPVVERGYLVSQYVAAGFVNAYRSALFPDADPLALDLPNPLGFLGIPQIPDRKTSLSIMVAMKVTGPVWVAKNSFVGMSALEMEQVSRGGFSKSTGSATRLILNGGRGLVRLAADIDPLAQGVAGVHSESDGEVCDSCKFLSTPIMKSDGARKMDAVAVGHDFCKCSARLVY